MDTPVMLLDNDEPICDFLVYFSYRTQRYEFPDVTPERWGLLFANWQALEARFQIEVAEYEAVTMKGLDNWIIGRNANA